MLKKPFLTFIAVFIFISSYGQTIKVIDNKTKEPIPFAEIFFPNLNKGQIANENGIIELNNPPKRKTEIIISSLGFKSLTTYADFSIQNDFSFAIEESHFKLNEVVISVPKGNLQNENVVSITTRKIKDLKEKSPITLAEAISSIPGVDQNSTGLGIGKPVIRGLSGSRIVTYTQGIRLENQQWGSEHGLGVGDIGISGVEVIKGPASLLYGADALGGVLFFNDEKYANENNIEAFAESKFLSNGLASYNNVGVKISKHRFSFNAFGAYNSSGDYKIPDNKNVFNTRFDEKNFKTSMGYSTDNWVSNLRYSYLKNNFGITEEDSLYEGTSKRELVLPFQTIVNNNLSFENTLFINDSRLNLVLGYTTNNRKEFEDQKDQAALNMVLKTSTYNLKWYSKSYNDMWSIILGSQGMYQTNTNEGEEVLIPNATTKDIGAFAMTNFKLGNLSMQGGIRIDQRTISAEEFIDETSTLIFPDFSNNYVGYNYSLGGAYTLNKSTFRLNLSSGFRAPNTTELLANGEHEGSGQYLEGNENLISENANQIDLEYDYTSQHFHFSINPFVNKINNYIYLDPTNREVDNVPVYEYKQTDAILYGGEVGFHYHPHAIHWLHISSDFSTVFAQESDGTPLPLIPQNRINTTVKAKFKQDGKFRINNVFIENTFKFKQDKVGIFETESPSYSLVNIGAKFELASKKLPLELTTGVKNLLNTKYIDHLSRLKPIDIPNQGINFYIGLKLNLSHSI